MLVKVAVPVQDALPQAPMSPPEVGGVEFPAPGIWIVIAVPEAMVFVPVRATVA